MKAGTFRPDLYYRLHVFCIDLPPLRDRREDIPLLVNHFLNKFCMATSRPVPQISREALELLMRHDWPGNVRELENAVERALVVGRGPEIRPADFSFQFQADEPRGGKTLDDVERAHIERILRETAAQPLARGAHPGYRPHHAVQQAAPLRPAVKPIHLIPLGQPARTRTTLGAEPGLERAGAPGGGAGAHLPHAVPHPAGDVRRLAFALDAQRGSSITPRPSSSGWSAPADPDARVLGVTACDLFVPVLTFVFGEAQLDGNCAVVSTARLQEEFYGLPRARGPAARAAGEGSRARTGPHLRPAPLRRLALRDGVQPRGGAAGCKGRGVLPGLPQAGLRERILVA